MSDVPANRARFEVAIVGGGPAGLAAGLKLAAHGLDVAIINRPAASAEPTPQKVGECLAPSCRPILERLGIADLVTAERHLPSPGNQSSWGHPALASLDFLFHPYGTGWHLDRASFESDLAHRAEAAGCRFVSANVRKVHQTQAPGWIFELDLAPGALESRFAIDASGRPSSLAHAAGAKKVRHDALIAVYAFLEPASAPIADATALIEARPDGWWYSAVVPGGRLSVAYLTDPDLLQASGGSSRAAWDERLRATVHTRQRLSRGIYRLIDDPRVAPAGSAILDRISGAGWIACGDAAASYDPLSSHGIATALASGCDTADALLEVRNGNPVPLAQYEQRIRRSFDYYLRMKRDYYAQEKRWSERPFWQRRTSG